MRSTLTQARALVAVMGAVALGLTGKILLGWPGALLGLAGGAAAGWFGAPLPRKFFHDHVARGLREVPSGQLRSELQEENWPVFHLYYRELQRRGEDLGADLPRILGFLEAEDPDQRLQGWEILKSCFPALAAKVPDYRPDAPDEECRSFVAALRSFRALPTRAPAASRSAACPDPR